MTNRTGEKVGWLGGWSGGFLWLAILSVVWLVQGLHARAFMALLLFVLGIAAIVVFAPWRHPRRPYRLLMLPVYIVLIVAVVSMILVIGAGEMGFSWGSMFWLFPLLIPLLTLGNRTWEDGNA